MITLPETWSPTVLEGLYLLDAKWREKRLGPLECIQEAYNIFATDEVKAGKKLTETDLDERIPALVFASARHFGWIPDPTERSVKRVRPLLNSYIPGATTNYPVTERIPDAELVESIGDIRVTAWLKTEFLGYLAGRQSYWRGKMYAQAQDTTAAAEVGAPEAGRPNESALGRNVDRLGDRKVPISQGTQSAETPAVASGFHRPDRKGDITLLQRSDGSRFESVDFPTAQTYADISPRRRQQLMKDDGPLKVVGKGRRRRITVESLIAYCPPAEDAK